MACQAQHASTLPFSLEHILQQILRPHVVLSKGFTVISTPQLIFLSETLLDRPSRVSSFDDRPRASTIARVLAHDLSRHFLDRGLEPSQPETRPFQLGGLQTPHQRTRNPRVGHGHLLFGKLLREESAGVAGLLFADRGQVSVDPVEFAVTV